MNETPSGHSRQECPSLDQLRAFAGRHSQHDEAASITDHLSRCSRCLTLLLTLPETDARLIELLRELSEEAHGRTTVADRPRHAGTRRQAGDEVPALRLGRYAILEHIGKGGFGTVYRAHDEELARLVAIKVPHAGRLLGGADLEACHTEARLHASLDHPHIVPIFDVGRTAEVPFYLVSKLVAGEDLATRIKRARPGPRESAALLAPLAEALDYMHGRGLVHRDVKPRNILLDEKDRPYLADFGLAFRPDPAAEAGAAVGLAAGTPAYMSPEQARGGREKLDGRTDLYSLGVVLYELLTGEKPFRGDVRELYDRIQNDEPRPPRQLAPEVPAELEAICLKAMDKDPAQRHQRGVQLAAELRRFLAGPAEEGGKRPWGPWHWGAVVALLALLAALAATVPKRDKPAPSPGVDDDAPQPHKVMLETQPPGAELSWFPLHPVTGMPRPDKVLRGKAGDQVELLPGEYLVVAVLQGQSNEPERFHEVFRVVPGGSYSLPRTARHQRWTEIDGVIHPEPIKLPAADVSKGMCLFPEAPDFLMGSKDVPLAPPHRRRIPAYYLDTTEVAAMPYALWYRSGKLDPREDEEVIRHPTYAAVGFSRPDEEVRGIALSWDNAANYAEKVGKRLPDEAEYEYAATACGKRRFPWGDAPDFLLPDRWTRGPVGKPEGDCVKIPGQPPVYGLCSNVAEWTSSWDASYPGWRHGDPDPRFRVIRGAPWNIINGNVKLSPVFRGPRERFLVYRAVNRLPGVGFRCARSIRPRLTAQDFVTVLDR
jgi:formylglycine-generating enzyme required for sulfatase activity